MKVRSFKLVDGEEVIGRLVSTNDEEGTFVMSHTRMMALVPQQDGNVGFTIVPFIAGNVDGEVTFRESSVMAEFKANLSVENRYLESTSSIQLAK